MSSKASDATMAVFLDLENIALGARDAKYPSFDVEKGTGDVEVWVPIEKAP